MIYEKKYYFSILGLNLKMSNQIVYKLFHKLHVLVTFGKQDI